MRIGILTTSLNNNYGGLLQAYALQTILKRLGHSPVILQRQSNSWAIRLLRIGKRILYLLRGKYLTTTADKKRIASNTSIFVDRYIAKSSELTSTKALQQYVKHNYVHGLVVGSDQVWRPIYSPCISNYFFDFAKNLSVQKRISYAASFGVDTWDFSPNQTKTCKELISLFDAVSVREKSGIDLCKSFLDADAQLVLDPTLLLKREDYEEIVRENNEQAINGQLFAYILDKTNSKNKIVEEVSQLMNYKSYSCMPLLQNYSDMTKDNIADFVYPRVTTWLRSFMDAKMVITDSFHGCVFSIIFNRPFWVIPNAVRGVTRFTSLLETFGLENRIVDINKYASINWNETIDWTIVNSRIQERQLSSLAFLEEALK